MSEQATSADPVDYPIVRIGEQSHTIKITCGTLIKLKKDGLNLFEQRPANAEAAAWGALLQEFQAAKSADVPDVGLVASLEKRVLESWALIDPLWRTWKSPLERGDMLDQLETACKVIAACISTDAKPVTAMDIAEQLDLPQLQPIIAVIIEAAKKVSASVATA